ncbi:unnamed protein product [Darwinula stevensoni]|uniref:START domain-containing protein n=1 Tax=Darwinula stevensoni TaxID=69355 RepID=A0A7R9A8R4_9CRUS|nr:unnamed protein product [Darwinula stevensoni]CAG0896693.1 unnamed protein product [Darwinula stevensoni]
MLHGSGFPDGHLRLLGSADWLVAYRVTDREPVGIAVRDTVFLSDGRKIGKNLGVMVLNDSEDLEGALARHRQGEIDLHPILLLLPPTSCLPPSASFPRRRASLVVVSLLSLVAHTPSTGMSTLQQPQAENCAIEGERALAKFRFNLERGDWTPLRDYGEERITVKSAYDQDTSTYFLLVQAPLDFECDWVIQDMRDHTSEATADWNSNVQEYKVLQRLSETCKVIHQVMKPKLMGFVASRDFVVLNYSRKDGDTQAEVKEGSGISFSPDPELHTRTLLRWVYSLDYKVPILPVKFLLKFHAEGCRQYILGLRKYLSGRHQHPVVVVQK